jgi:hypothetical protein
MVLRRLTLTVACTSLLALVPAGARGEILHDQLNNDALVSMPNGVSSTKSSIQNQQAADDFVVPAGQAWAVNRVEARAEPGFGFATSFNVFFYVDAGGVPQEAAEFMATGVPLAAGGSTTQAILDLNAPAYLGAGKHWVSVQGIEASPNEWLWFNRTIQDGSPAALRGVGGCPITWKTRTGCGYPAGNPDQVFRVSGTRTGGGDTTSPQFTGKASASPATFAVDPAGKAESPVSGVAVKKGTTLRYSLSEAARVTFTIERKTRGRRVARRCRKPTRKNRKSKRCTRYARVGAFRQQSVAGSNRKRFSGKIGRKGLRPGGYRALLVAVDAAGNRSKAKSVGFRVVRRR